VIVEHALLPVTPGREDEFEVAMRRARSYIAETPGFISLSVSRSVEHPSTYLLLVQWERLEDHTEGFRQSSRYQPWRESLHHFYETFPEVQHFAPVDL
jgi:heme-degrading monooxygenase HmoA